MKMLKLAVAVSLAFAAQSAAAGAFDSGIPVGWTTVGSAGTLGANGVVTLAPGGGTAYGWVSTAGGAGGAGQLPGIGGTNGSSLTSSIFAATSGDVLKFSFNYVTSDGAGFADYAWSQLLDSAGAPVAVLFDARTKPSGDIVPGFGLPPISATLAPPTSAIIPGGPAWAPLGSSSGACYSGGCGYTGWITATYAIPTTSTYKIAFGVTNWSDTAYDSGLAFDGITVAGVPVGAIPEPETYAMLLAGLGLMGFLARRRKQKEAAAA